LYKIKQISCELNRECELREKNTQALNLSTNVLEQLVVDNVVVFEGGSKICQDDEGHLETQHNMIIIC